MIRKLNLQVGGTLNPRRNIYITRPEDDRLYDLLREGHYVNLLSSRQMGKSSLMVRTAARLAEDGIHFVAIDLAGDMGGTLDSVEPYYMGLLAHIARDLRLSLDLEVWWHSLTTETWNQRLLRFFRDVVSQQIEGRVVIFLDEIDSTLKLPFTDDLFTAIRSMYNERPLVAAYEQISFCLIGVATANELIKDRRTTPYNVGETLELDDFDAGRDNLDDLARVLHEDEQQGRALLERVLYWTGGHPYLTAKLCTDLLADQVSTPADVDRYVEQEFASLERVRNDTHFQAILRFVEQRLSSGLAALKLYRRIYRGAREKDIPGVAQNELKLSGLIKRDAEGYLVVRNPIYRRVFDLKWVASLSPLRQSALNRFIAIGALLVVVVVLLFVVVETVRVPGVNSANFSPDGKLVVTASRDETARIWDVGTGMEINTLKGGLTAKFAAFSPDGKRVVTTSWDDATRVWDVGTGKQIGAPIKGHTSTVNSAAFSPDGKLEVTASSDKVARIWDVSIREEIAILRGHTAAVNSAAFSPDGKLVVTASWDDTARIWDVKTGKEINILQGHTSKVNSAAFSPDGKRVVTASWDDTARIWDVDTGKEIAILKGHTADVNSAAFSPDGKLVVTASDDGTARLWQTESGRPLKTFGQITALQSECLQLRQSGLHRSLMSLTFWVTLVLLDWLVIRDVIDSGLATSGSKAAWAMIVVLLPFLGMLFWFIFGRRRAGGKVAGAQKV